MVPDQQALERLHRLVFDGEVLQLPRLRPLLIGRPHPKRQLQIWGGGRVIRRRAGQDRYLLEV